MYLPGWTSPAGMLLKGPTAVEEGRRRGLPTPTGPSGSLEHRPLAPGLESQPYWGLAPLEAPYKVALEAGALGCLEGGCLESCNSRVMSL